MSGGWVSPSTFGVFWAAEGIEEAWPSAVILLGFIAILHFGRDRSDTLCAIFGVTFIASVAVLARRS